MEKKKASAKKTAEKKGGKRLENLEALAGEAEKIIAELAITRPAIFENERVERKKIEEKILLEDELAEVLKGNFAEERAFLASVKKTEERKEEILKEKISALERIMAIYKEKKSKLTEQKKRKTLLEKELRTLSEQKKELSSYG